MPLLGVRSYGLGARSDVPEWFRIEGGRHLADFGLDLIVEGTTCSITWRQTARQFALAVEVGHHLSDSLLAGWFEDVSVHPDWRPFIGRRIERARWISLPETEAAQEEDHDSGAMELTSEGGASVQIMAAYLVDDPDEPLMSGDDVVILFGQIPEVRSSSPA